jgi:hypothetical protein
VLFSPERVIYPHTGKSQAKKYNVNKRTPDKKTISGLMQDFKKMK